MGRKLTPAEIAHRSEVWARSRLAAERMRAALNAPRGARTVRPPGNGETVSAIAARVGLKFSNGRVG